MILNENQKSIDTYIRKLDMARGVEDGVKEEVGQDRHRGLPLKVQRNPQYPLRWLELPVLWELEGRSSVTEQWHSLQRQV
ncbi:hypothetical protein BFJ63_vAg14809 [Fusarium oxysporum f. sp. narcissi]|uniref:Uncharacterized protein n=1 Tax=Fusarium oxysporum f. sp. narcissi TaxID=451672 RepID=A0A4Q2VDV7_FUSOX|nr:hypothetical protein BFJ70_g4527 [Fusarium oxysporum]RYC82323.1 hypothetical protein BFJ63_vAg14809 [Fusarium oxysporum f. sp. narcissi]